LPGSKPNQAPDTPSEPGIALTIAGYDPSSGAGITADLFVFAAHHLTGISAITALTVQSTTGVRAVHPVDPAILTDILACIHADLPAAGIKIGMLATAANVSAVAQYLQLWRTRHASGPVVLDPVIRSSSGRELLDTQGLRVLQTELLPLVDWITPNLDELALLTGHRVTSREDVEPAARTLQTLFVKSDGARIGVFATGGHLQPPDDLLLTPSGEAHWLPGQHLSTRATHGTGCALSSAFLSLLIIGHSPHQAAHNAKQYVRAAMENATPYGSGAHGINHLWNISNPPLYQSRKRPVVN
jgi:hydroxymethylpyrimidine/phosphomethylpyrimidine kinase